MYALLSDQPKIKPEKVWGSRKCHFLG